MLRIRQFLAFLALIGIAVFIGMTFVVSLMVEEPLAAIPLNWVSAASSPVTPPIIDPATNATVNTATGGGPAALTITLCTTACAVSDVLVVQANAHGGAYITGVADTSGQTAPWRRRQSCPQAGAVTDEWFTTTTGSGPFPITVTINTGGSLFAIAGAAIKGANAPAPFDTNSPPLATCSIQVTSTTATTTSSNDIILAFFDTGLNVPTADSGWSTIANSNVTGAHLLAVYKTSTIPVTSMNVQASGAPLANAILVDALTATPSTPPTGLYYQALDGEKCTNILDPSTCTNSFYSSRGFTYASSNSPFPNFDSKSFVPISAFDIQSNVTEMVALKINVANSTGSNTAPTCSPLADYSPFTTNGIPIQSNESACTSTAWQFVPGGASPQDPPQAAVFGMHLDEASNPQGHVANIVNAQQAGRVWDYAGTAALLIHATHLDNGVTLTQFMSGVGIYPMPSGGYNYFANVGFDFYWMAVSTVSGGSGDSSPAQSCAIVIASSANCGTGLTVDQGARPMHYGFQIDYERWNASGQSLPYPFPSTLPPSPIPISNYIETKDGFVANPGHRTITPQEMNAAAFSDITHGARYIQWFCCGNSLDFDNTTPIGGVTIYNQLLATDTMIGTTLASVINSPFAINYVSASPAGYTYPLYSSIFWDSFVRGANQGAGTMAKCIVSGSTCSHYYVFAEWEGSEQSLNQSVTFTILKEPGMNTTIPVVGESRNVTATCGATTCTFTDTFNTTSGQPNGFYNQGVGSCSGAPTSTVPNCAAIGSQQHVYGPI